MTTDLYQMQRAMRHMRKTAMQRGVVAILDVGTSKVACLVLRFDGPDQFREIEGVGPMAGQSRFRVIGAATTRSRGMRFGEIDTMTETAAAEGVEMRFDKIRPGNTFDAHRLLHLAKLRGLQGDLKERLLRAYLCEGASMGDHDYIPAVIKRAGGTIAFHKLPVRPGKPMLAGVGPQGQAIIALPGNPVSAMVTLRRFGLAALRQRAGFATPLPAPASVKLATPDDKSLGLWCYRLVRLTGSGKAQLVASMGSGDYASAAQSDGLIEVPPGTIGAEPLNYYPWPID